jgi:hypothetical protein
MGARDLYVAEVYDVARTGETQKPYGRVLYTKGKSLIFYAYDLDQETEVKNATTFQVWGRRGQWGCCRQGQSRHQRAIQGQKRRMARQDRMAQRRGVAAFGRDRRRIRAQRLEGLHRREAADIDLGRQGRVGKGNIGQRSLPGTSFCWGRETTEKRQERERRANPTRSRMIQVSRTLTSLSKLIVVRKALR